MRQRAATLTYAILLALVAGLAAPMAAEAELFKIKNAGEALVFYPNQEAKGFELFISGPCQYSYRVRTQESEIVFELPKDAMDGTYSYSIDLVPIEEEGRLNAFMSFGKAIGWAVTSAATGTLLVLAGTAVVRVSCKAR